jgi:DNA-binding transcriptional LysR family regulator
VLTSNSTHVLCAAARSGIGIAVLPRFMADRTLIAVSEDLSAQDLWLVTHPDFRRDPKIRAVASYLRRAASSLV